MEYKRNQRAVCLECKHGKQRFMACCYCVKYGITIGYSKTECRGFEREQVQESENDCGRNHVRFDQRSEQVGRT